MTDLYLSPEDLVGVDPQDIEDHPMLSPDETEAALEAYSELKDAVVAAESEEGEE